MLSRECGGADDARSLAAECRYFTIGRVGGGCDWQVNIEIGGCLPAERRREVVKEEHADCPAESALRVALRPLGTHVSQRGGLHM